MSAYSRRRNLLSPAPYPRTDHANLLILEYPIPTGWSYNTTSQIPHDSSTRAVETLMTSFKLCFVISLNLNNGGTRGIDGPAEEPECRDVFHKDQKHIDQLVLSNSFGDVVTVIYQNLHHLCYTSSAILPASSCETLQSYLTPCLDRLTFLTSESTSHLSTRETRLGAVKYCILPFELTWKDARIVRHDNRKLLVGLWARVGGGTIVCEF
ncbi:hypothetical protein I305_06084 [Cryptococcus gattii E566]|uniref:Uncharacterized protein n=2 Tax=Cryptococcus gattii TaxID=37769 RepID=E6RCI7_CRYGW|nr:Hypothetical Protein CGB_J0115C [Cryptococcus gattii WM276]ADV24592.1 Hypothetical Protein CGB_J0115C [Cryptococcus gattii WM276]KIR80287.1 hypothetical protein I306_02627 [Cryptococcus gattii EJB2]KIY31397.1 hypothetical protein I305_06084 [Cryptococcus gattii E566]KJE01297.1 hypothetical protein I311_05055 [Cryptococcus gattii NT-10]